jgi:hypothetical protein
MTCTKCGCKVIVDARVHSCELPAIKCVCCGKRWELYYIPTYIERPEPEKTGPIYAKCATPSCNKKIDTRCNNGGKCKSCRLDDEERAKIALIEANIKRRQARMERRAA